MYVCRSRNATWIKCGQFTSILLTKFGTETLALGPVLLMNRYYIIFVSQLWRNQFLSKFTDIPEQKAWGYNNTTIVITVAMATQPLASICMSEVFPKFCQEFGWLSWLQIPRNMQPACNSNSNLWVVKFVDLQNYLPELSASTICLNYLPELSARTICQNYLPELSAWTITIYYIFGAISSPR